MSFNITAKKSVREIRVTAKEARAEAGLDELASQVVIVIDRSPSMDDSDKDFFRSGIVDGLVTRSAISAFEFDSDKVIPVYALDEGVERMPDLTPDTLEGYVDRHFRKRGSGTNYAPTMEAILRDAKPGDPELVLYFTDGENYDQDRTMRLLKDASRLPIFWQFFGIYGRRPGRFSFLESLDTIPDSQRVIDNAGFSPLGLHTITDQELFVAMMKEYQKYPALARRAGLLPWKADNVYGRGGSSNSGSSGGGLGSRLRGWLS